MGICLHGKSEDRLLCVLTSILGEVIDWQVCLVWFIIASSAQFLKNRTNTHTHKSFAKFNCMIQHVGFANSIFLHNFDFSAVFTWEILYDVIYFSLLLFFFFFNSSLTLSKTAIDLFHFSCWFKSFSGTSEFLWPFDQIGADSVCRFVRLGNAKGVDQSNTRKRGKEEWMNGWMGGYLLVHLKIVQVWKGKLEGGEGGKMSWRGNGPV